MGKVIRYTNKDKEGARGFVFRVNPHRRHRRNPRRQSEGKTSKIRLQRGAKRILNLHKLLLLDLMDKEEFAQAKIVAKHLTDLQPEEPYAWYLRGVALLDLSDPEQAEPCLLKSMEIQGTDAATAIRCLVPACFRETWRGPSTGAAGP